MPSVPPESVRAAMAARSHALVDRPDPMVLSEFRLTEMMLEAAAPILADEAARKILLHMERSTGRRGRRNRRGLRAYRRHMSTAARVAATAFSTDDDLRRAAVEHLQRVYRKHVTDDRDLHPL